MGKKKPNPKTTPGLVPIRLHLTPAERDRLRVVAAQAGKPMAVWCREAIRKAMDGTGKPR